MWRRDKVPGKTSLRHFPVSSASAAKWREKLPLLIVWGQPWDEPPDTTLIYYSHISAGCFIDHFSSPALSPSLPSLRYLRLGLHTHTHIPPSPPIAHRRFLDSGHLDVPLFLSYCFLYPS
uniref:Uncharacterized protein n=1 Tax=Knipowitschia caucasica TaxID=637954 RepID=A0AAV2L1M9_KNICA